jgi:hypothetical protein
MPRRPEHPGVPLFWRFFDEMRRGRGWELYHVILRRSGVLRIDGFEWALSHELTEARGAMTSLVHLSSRGGTSRGAQQRLVATMHRLGYAQEPRRGRQGTWGRACRSLREWANEPALLAGLDRAKAVPVRARSNLWHRASRPMRSSLLTRLLDEVKVMVPSALHLDIASFQFRSLHRIGEERWRVIHSLHFIEGNLDAIVTIFPEHVRARKTLSAAEKSGDRALRSMLKRRGYEPGEWSRHPEGWWILSTDLRRLPNLQALRAERRWMERLQLRVHRCLL